MAYGKCMPYAQPLFLNESSALNHLLLFFFPPLIISGNLKTNWMSPLPPSCEMTAVSKHSMFLFSSFGMWKKSLEKSSVLLHLPHVILALQMPVLSFLYVEVEAGKTMSSTLCPSHCAMLINFFSIFYHLYNQNALFYIAFYSI